MLKVIYLLLEGGHIALQFDVLLPEFSICSLVLLQVLLQVGELGVLFVLPVFNSLELLTDAVEFV